MNVQRARAPVLCVHGINDDASDFGDFRAHLLASGWARVDAIDLVPNLGEVSIRVLAEQVQAAAEKLLAETGATALDVVGFSMGALVSRYYVQRLGGKERVRRFLSISGPQEGTVLAYFSGREGIRDMRPESNVLRDLSADADPWGRTEVHAFWTPLDLVIVPPKSSRLPGARERQFPVLLHPLMLKDRRVLEAAVEVLGG